MDSLNATYMDLKTKMKKKSSTNRSTESSKKKHFCCMPKFYKNLQVGAHLFVKHNQ